LLLDCLGFPYSWECKKLFRRLPGWW